MSALKKLDSGFLSSQLSTCLMSHCSTVQHSAVHMLYALRTGVEQLANFGHALDARFRAYAHSCLQPAMRVCEVDAATRALLPQLALRVAYALREMALDRRPRICSGLRPKVLPGNPKIAGMRCG